ncbi:MULTISPECIES: barstar family protein [unclassified Gordonia (in: high G+C Gram-positive bacteria)]
MSGDSRTIDEFLSDAGRGGPAVGLITDALSVTSLPSSVADSYEVRVVDGDHLRSLPQLYAAFADGWGFPSSFGKNKDAFDDAMRDLDNLTADAGSPPRRGYLTAITHAQHLLTASDTDFDWFAESLPFYRDHYRDFSDPPVIFAVLLSTPMASRRATVSRWQRAGIRLAPVSV